MTRSIGSRIRLLRRQQQRTLQDVADVCGFTRSLLCKIEKGATVPAIATLAKISEALGVRTSVLLGEGNDTKSVFVAASERQGKGLIRTAKGYRFHAFAAKRPDKTMQPYFFTARKGEVKRAPLSHAGQEFVYMLEGSMKYRVGSVEYLLKPGDALYFDALEEHDFEPVTTETRFLAVFTDPADIISREQSCPKKARS
jgi:transcriptional regulator with XRE-family HTH domain